MSNKADENSQNTDDPAAEDNIQPNQKVQVWILVPGAQSGPQVLLLKTTEERGGFWQPVTGSVEEGESLEAAASRECKEETGFEGTKKPKPIGFDFTFEGKEGLAHEHCFKLELDDCAPPFFDPREHVEARWVPLDKARKMLKFESNIEALDRVVEGMDLAK